MSIAERVAAYNAGDMDKVARIDKREKECREWKVYHSSARKHRAGISKVSFSKVNSSSGGTLSLNV